MVRNKRQLFRWKRGRDFLPAEETAVQTVMTGCRQKRPNEWLAVQQMLVKMRKWE